jgi:hypothetical protein
MKLSSLKKLFTLIFITCIINNTFSQAKSENITENKVKKVRYSFITELFYLKKESNSIPYNYVQSTMSLRVINGIQFKNRISIGVGIAAEANALPLSFDLKLSPKGNVSVPVLGLNMGYDFFNKGEGVRINPTLGIKKFLTDKTALLINFGVYWYESSLTTTSYRIVNYNNQWGSGTNYIFNSNTSNTNNLFLLIGGGLSF